MQNCFQYKNGLFCLLQAQLCPFKASIDRLVLIDFLVYFGCTLNYQYYQRMGNVCHSDQTIKQQDIDGIMNVKVVQIKPEASVQEDLIRKYSSLRSQAPTFPHVNNHVEEKIKRFSKFQPSTNKSWRLKSPYNLIYTNQEAQDQYELPKGYVKIYKLKENGDFQGYYEGKVTPHFQSDLTQAFFVFHNASYFEGKGVNYGIYTNQVTNLKYQGGWVNQQPHGKGKQQNNKGFYEGQYFQGEKHGQGRFIWNDGSSYMGTFVKGSFHGKGVYVNKTLNQSYEGDYSNDLKHGIGIETKQKQIYQGQFFNNKRCGKGRLSIYQDQTKKEPKYIYEGVFVNNKPHGRGTFIDTRTLKRIDGIWDNGILISICQ